MSSPFGWRTDPIDRVPAFHRGIDIAAPIGTPITAPEAGSVIVVGEDASYGLCVVVDHGDGVTTWYAHLEHAEVTVVDRVESGGRIGTIGMSGRTTGPHLHFEVRYDDRVTDPIVWLDGDPMPAAALASPERRPELRTSTSA
jgi:murein DD-endopeptidase MepM/ murein hydrolase activator NlpD